VGGRFDPLHPTPHFPARVFPAEAVPLPAALVVTLALVALAQWTLVVWAWHAALERAMRARGLARWSVGDTLLVSPLFAGGTLVAVAALDWALTRAALHLASDAGGARLAPTLAPALLLAAAATVVSAFGVRAVGKLY